MLEIKFIRQNMATVEAALAARGQSIALSQFKTIDDQHRNALLEIEELRHRRNVVSEEIAQLKKSGGPAESLVLEMRSVGAKIKALENAVADAHERLQAIVMGLPNIPHASVPVGRDSTENPVIKIWGEPQRFDFEPKAHWDIGSRLKILDLERAAKITGARFPLYFNAGARLERAIINFMLDVHTREHNYREVLPPFIVNRKSMTSTGQLPKFEQDLFKLEQWDYFLIPTAEVPLTNIHQDEILDEAELPIFYTAYTPCFRSEAGSHGKDTRGLIRQHQFNKVELVKFCKPEDSYVELESLLRQAESILVKLGLPYRVVALCTGDMGFSAAKTYDIEVWMPYQKTYREISSCSNFEDFQSRRGSIRFRRKGKKGTELVHTLNGSGLAVGRTFAAILENFQCPDGSVVIPEALRPYMDGMERLST
jgi:seryl-tRNA synthetase